MESSIRSATWLMLALLQRLAVVTLILVTLALVGYDILAALGQVPWLSMSLTFGETSYAQAGMAVQLGVTALLALLCVYLPANSRIMALENSHRSFHMGMRDVAMAYAHAHASDREGVFTMASEFDSIRERINFLRQHPDLGHLQGEVLEVAAQMSHVSRELAQIYSDRNVARARDFLVARQQEIEDFNTRIAEAKAISVEIRQWTDTVEVEEAIAQSQLDRLREDLFALVPELVSDLEAATREAGLTTAAAMPEPERAQDVVPEPNGTALARDAAPFPEPATPIPHEGNDRIVKLLSARLPRG